MAETGTPHCEGDDDGDPPPALAPEGDADPDTDTHADADADIHGAAGALAAPTAPASADIPAPLATPGAPAGVAPPRQQRSRETYERILDAADRLLAEQSFDALRIEDLLAAARVSAGSFYARFEGKDAILAALYHRYQAELVESLRRPAPSAPPGAGLEDRARVFIRARIRRYRARKGTLRAVALDLRLHPERYQAEMRELNRRATERMVEVLRPCLNEIPGDGEARLRTMAYFVSAICRDRILFSASPHAASTRVSLAQLEDELVRLAVGYLRAE
jgi:AcrR family transcriptional regulator